MPSMQSLHRTLLATLLAASSGLSLAQEGSAPAAKASDAAPAASAASAPEPTSPTREPQEDTRSLDAEMPPEMPPEHPKMQAAFKKGRTTLARFLNFAAKSTEPRFIVFSVKAAFKEGDKTEYMWVTPFQQDNKKALTGRLNDLPRIVTSVKQEQQVRVQIADVVDWMYYDSSQHRMYGNYTTCARLILGSPKDVEDVKRIFGLDCKTNDMR